MNKLHVQSQSTSYIKSFPAIVLATSLLIPIPSQATNELSLGYQYDTQGNVLRDAKGNCLRSAQWSATNAIAECDPKVVEQRSEMVPVREKKAKLVSTAGVTEIYAQVDIVVLQPGKGFDFQSAELSATGKQQLAAVMSRHTGDYIHRVYVNGYTDQTGDKDYDLQLAQKRADSVKADLVAHGIPSERIVVSTLASEYLIATCPNATGDALIECLAPNRRTEAKFVIPVVRTAASAEFVERRRQEEIKDSNVKAEAVVVNASLIDDGYNKAVKIIGEGCSSEVAAFCGDIAPGQGRILNCLKSNDSKLSSTCKQSITQGKSTMESALGNANYFGSRCGSEIARHCSNVTPGSGGIVACLKQNSMNLEKRCYDAMQELDLM
jgi:OOP family OmpA-OmpF porin